MSVHGEYERSLENLILHLGQRPAPPGTDWADAFSALRMKHQPDLSSAARECLVLIDRMESEIPALAAGQGAPQENANPLGNILNEAASHLGAHCRAVLGVTALNQQ